MKNESVGFTILVLLFAILAAGVCYHYRVPPSLKINQLKLETFDGRQLAPSVYKDKVVVLSFYKSWCGSCIAEMSELEELSNHYADNLVVICVDDEDLEKQKRVSNTFTEGEIIFVNTKASFKDLGIHTFPTNYIFDKTGEKIYEKSGTIAWLSDEIKDKLKLLIEK